MNIRVAACGLLCFFTACSVPSPRDASNSTHPVSTTETATPQNYSPSAQFMQHHGDFMLRREPWRAEAQVSGLIMDGAKIKGERGSHDLRRVKADIERRVNLADYDVFVDFAFRYDNRYYSFSPGARATKAGQPGTQAPSSISLHRATATIQYGQFLDKDLLLEVDVMPGVWTDFGGTLQRQDWRLYGRGLLTYRYSEELFLMVGAENSGLFRSVDAYPLLGTAWIPDPEWRVDVLLPRQVRLTHTPDPHNSIFLSVDLGGGTYRVAAPRAGQSSRRISVQEFEVSLGAEHRFDANLSAFGRLGTTIGGHYEFRNTAGSGSYSGTLEAQVFLEVGLGWSF